MKEQIDGFRAYLQIEAGLGPRTIAAYAGDLDRFRVWLDTESKEGKQGLPKSWEDVEVSDFRGYLAFITGSERPKPAKPKYLHRVVSTFRRFGDYLVKIAAIRPDNPARELSKPKLPKRYPEILTENDITRLIETAMQSRSTERVRNWAMIVFLHQTWIRVSEFCDLRISRISMREGFPRSIRVIGKGDKERIVPLSREASKALTAWLRERRRLVADTPKEFLDHVWLIPTGRKCGHPIQPQGVQATLASLGRKAGIVTRVHPHKLRHTGATLGVRKGAKLPAIQSMLGHASIATTGIYLHADESELQEVAELLGKHDDEPPNKLDWPEG